jgi:hypothetical protein
VPNASGKLADSNATNKGGGHGAPPRGKEFDEKALAAIEKTRYINMLCIL